MELLPFVASVTDFDDWDHHRTLDMLTLYFPSDADSLAWTLCQSGCSFRNLSILDRVHHSTSLLYREFECQRDAARLVRLVFEDMKLDATVCKTTDDYGQSLIHAIAWNISIITERQLVSDQPGNDFSALDSFLHCSSELLSLSQEIIRVSSNLHGLAFYLVWPSYSFREASLRTPLLMAFFGSLHLTWSISKLVREYGIIKFARLSMMTWIERLQTVGIDLVEYGRKEKELHIQEKVNKEYFYRQTQPTSHQRTFTRIRLISFTYGPEPVDWHFWFTEVMESYFTQFWDMVDHPESAMPGAWIEDEDPYHGYINVNLCYDYDPEYDSPPTVEDCDRWKPSDEPWPTYDY